MVKTSMLRVVSSPTKADASMSESNYPPTLRRLAGILTIIAIVFFSGCGDQSENFFEEEYITEDVAVGFTEAYDALEVDYLIEAFLKNIRTSYDDGCFAYTNDSANHHLVIDFGLGKECSNTFPYGRARLGKILVSYPENSMIGDTLSNRRITFDGYFVSGKKLTGEIDLVSLFRDTTDQKIHGTVEFHNFKVNFPQGSSVIYNGSHTRIWSDGEGDIDNVDNLYTVSQLSDSSTVSDPVSRALTYRFLRPIQLNYACALSGNLAATSGVVELSSISGYDNVQRKADFGANTCDHLITITTPRRTYTSTVY